MTQLANIIALKAYGPSDVMTFSFDVRWGTRVIVRDVNKTKG